MQRKAYVPGTVVLLAALLAACTGGSGSGASEDDKAGGSTTTAPAAQPGRYSTLSDACTMVDHDALDTMLPGLKQLTDEEQREQAYEGEATLTYDNDRRSGCRWKADSSTATDQLFLDLERVVSYDTSVSDDDSAAKVFREKADAADIPEGGGGSDASGGAEDGSGGGSSASADPSASASTESAASTESSASDDSSTSAGSTASGDSGTSAALQPRTLDDLGDEAFVDDELSATQQRTVAVVFRTSNVVVTVQYEEQSTHAGEAPGSKEMQDRARKLARQLADSFQG